MNTFENFTPTNNLPNIKITISQYDSSDREIGRYTGTFSSVFDCIPNFEKYYYRVTALGKTDAQGRVITEHFGVKTTSIGGFKLSEESFINSFLNFEIKEYSKQKANNCIEWDFNFSYELIHDFWYIDRLRTLRQNSSEGFNAALDHFLNKSKQFYPLTNLNDVKEVSGIYLLVLDEYNICYLGQADDIRKRIMRHWSRNDYFTGTGIDMFKAKDTTRIYVAPVDRKRKINSLEHKSIKTIPPRYTLNILAGGDIDYLASHSMQITKGKCTDSEYINYVTQNYDVVERIHANKNRFVVE